MNGNGRAGRNGSAAADERKRQRAGGKSASHQEQWGIRSAHIDTTKQHKIKVTQRRKEQNKRIIKNKINKSGKEHTRRFARHVMYV